MSATRRAILKLIGMAPAAAGSVASSLKTTLGTAQAMAAAGLITVPAGDEVPQQTGADKRSPIQRELQRLFNRYQDENYPTTQAFRIDGIDPDIAVLKSTSRAYKVLKQRQREIERVSLECRVKRLLWGDNW